MNKLMESVPYPLIFEEFDKHIYTSSPQKDSYTFSECFSDDLMHLVSQKDDDANCDSHNFIPFNNDIYCPLNNDIFETTLGDVLSVCHGTLDSDSDYLNILDFDGNEILFNNNEESKANASLDALNISSLFDETQIHNVLSDFITEFDKVSESPTKLSTSGIEASDGFGLLDKFEKELEVSVSSTEELIDVCKIDDESNGSKQEFLKLKNDKNVNQIDKKLIHTDDASCKDSYEKWNTEYCIDALHSNKKINKNGNIKPENKLKSKMESSQGSTEYYKNNETKLKETIAKIMAKKHTKEKEMKERAKALSEAIQNKLLWKSNLCQEVLKTSDHMQDHDYANNIVDETLNKIVAKSNNFSKVMPKTKAHNSGTKIKSDKLTVRTHTPENISNTKNAINTVLLHEKSVQSFTPLSKSTTATNLSSIRRNTKTLKTECSKKKAEMKLSSIQREAKIIMCPNGNKSYKKMTSILNVSKFNNGFNNVNDVIDNSYPMKKNNIVIGIRDDANNVLLSKCSIIKNKDNLHDIKKSVIKHNSNININEDNGKRIKNINLIKSSNTINNMDEKMICNDNDVNIANTNCKTNQSHSQSASSLKLESCRISQGNLLQNICDTSASMEVRSKSAKPIEIQTSNQLCVVPDISCEVVVGDDASLDANSVSGVSKVKKKLSLSDYKLLLPKRKALKANKPISLPEVEDTIEYDYSVTSDHNYYKNLDKLKHSNVATNNRDDCVYDMFPTNEPENISLAESTLNNMDEVNNFITKNIVHINEKTVFYGIKEIKLKEDLKTTNRHYSNCDNKPQCQTVNFIEKMDSTLVSQFIADLQKKRKFNGEKRSNVYSSKKQRVIHDSLEEESNVIIETKSSKTCSVSSGIISDYELSPSISSQKSGHLSRSRSRSRSNFSSKSRSSSKTQTRSQSSSRSRSNSRSKHEPLYRTRLLHSSRKSYYESRNKSRSQSRSSYASSSRSHSRSNSESPLKSNTSSPNNDSKSARSASPRIKKDRRIAMEERRVVYINRLPSNYTRFDLEKKMRYFGQIIESSIHIRNERDCFGFVTYATSLQAAQAIQDGCKVAGCETFEFCYGGRREFCGSNYSDLDHEAVCSSKKPQFVKKDNASDFQNLLKETLACIKSTHKCKQFSS